MMMMMNSIISNVVIFTANIDAPNFDSQHTTT